SMAGINAAFVITKRTDQQIGISARSNGSINVQIIMENLGGGGTLSCNNSFILFSPTMSYFLVHLVYPF
ncbi:hypothetical protein, partial [Enterococcus faecalis]|uniref:hypothetical protein n=1 Tax=Enterococcus faecalis TaxID=1351 RepID=UPI0025536C80